MDRISKLPVGIIETILCLLPIQEAARTSILAKEWRNHWTKIPKLVFDEDTFQVPTHGTVLSVLEQTFEKPSKRRRMDKRCKLFYAIYQVLLMHQGPIHEFTLSMDADVSCVEIDHIILHLSKINTVKKFALYMDDFHCEYVLPVSFFSLHQLTEVYLEDCALLHEPSFCEFGCLTTLYLHRIWTYPKMLLRFLSSCPSLKRLILHSDGGTISGLRDSTIVDLFECVPMIEYLSVRFHIVKCFIPERLPKELPKALVFLKCLQIKEFFFSHKYGLPFLVLLVKSSPNLEKLELVLEDLDWPDEEDIGSFTLEDYSDLMFEHLNELEIRHFTDIEYELDFVRLILAKSPVLNKVRIFPHRCIDEEEASEISELLLCFPCASPVVKITVREF